MHVAQVNFLRAPAAYTADDVLARWPSLVDIAEAVGSSGVRVSVVQAATRSERTARNGIDFHFIDVEGAGDALVRGRLFASVLERCGADILHVHGLGFAEDASAVSRWLPRLPVLFQDHAGAPPPWWRRRQWRRWFAPVAGFAFTAPEQAHPFSEAGLIAPHARVYVIPESSSRFNPGARARARVATGLYGDPCVLWVGHLVYNKDPLTVLDGVARAVRRLGRLQLWCAFGRAPLLEAVQRRIHDPRLAGRVHLLGEVAHARVETLMQAADLYVSGSHAEGSGYALLEAMACGLDPVVTDIPPFRALTGAVGHRWPCGDAARLADALVAGAEARTPPARVRAHFDANLSLAALGRRWSAAYAQVLADRGRRAA